jgi:vitamin B12 transporter
MNRKKLAILMAAMLCSKGLQAEEASKGYISPEVVVSATKTLNSISDAGGSSVTVITSKEIHDSGQSTVEALIKSVVGVDVVSNGGIGSSSSIFLRGADTKYTLVLMDGIPVNDPSMMHDEANLSDLMVDNIDRIEILRGPSSMLYGSSAEAGVINIITKKGTEKSSLYVGTEGGSYGTYKVYGGGSGKQGILDYAVSFSRMKTDGFSALDERNRVINPTGRSFEKDGYNNNTVSGNFGLKFSKQVSLETSLRYTDTDLNYDGFLSDVAGDVQMSKLFYAHTALKLDFQPLLSTLYWNVSNQDRKYIDINYGNSAYHGHLYEIGWQGDYALSGNNTLSAGLSSRTDSMTTTGIIDRYTITSNSVFLQDQWHLGCMRLVEGIRFENNEQFGSKTTWRIAPSFTFGDTLLKCSYATGFKAPSLYELYAPYSVGNDKLQAETSKGWDIGVEQKIAGNLKAGVSYFRTDYENRIDWTNTSDYVNYPWGGYYDQVPGMTKTYGTESFVEWKPVDSFFVVANYTWLRTRDTESNELQRRPRNKVGLTTTWKASSRLSLNTNMQWVGTRQDASAPDGKLDSYCRVNLSAFYKLNGNVELYGRIDNLFNRYYEEAWSYATPGRSAYAGVKVSL